MPVEIAGSEARPNLVEGPILGEDMIRRRIVAGGHQLQVAVIGDLRPGQPALVFLHEGLGSIGQWRDYPRALGGACDLPLVIYERWGFGGSEPLTLPRPRDYLTQEAEVALPELLAGLGVDRPVLYGHSDGGTIALLYGAAKETKPVCIITEAAHVFVEEISLAGIRDAVRAWETSDLPQRLARYHGSEAETVFRGWAETWLRPDFRDWSMTDRLARIDSPCLVCQGADDQYGSLDQVEAILSGVSGPAEPLVLPNCGHTPHREARDEMLRAAKQFILRHLDGGLGKETPGRSR